MTRKAFIENYMPLGEALYRLAFHLLESRDDAEDAVQDLYIRLWTEREKLDSVHNPKAYCITLLKNMCIDRIRKAAKAPMGGLTENLAGSGPPEEETFGKERLKAVVKAIEKLPERQQRVVQMRFFEDLSYEEMGRKTGMSNLTLRVLLSQARQKLRKAF